MAFITGTAADYTDFWDTLQTFLTTDAALVALNQQWEVAWSAPVGAPNSTDVVLKGPGLAGDDEVFIGLRLVADTVGSRYSIHICGMTGVLPAATTFDGHVNCSPVVRMFLDNVPMTYWMVANGRRFMMVAKISTVYEAAHAGLFLPFATPSQYPYPMFIGGTANANSNSVDWRAVSADHSMFHRPKAVTSGSQGPSSYMLSPEGSWHTCRDYDSDSGDIAVSPDYFGSHDFNMAASFTNFVYGYRDIKNLMTACYGGGYILTPLMLLRSNPQSQTYGLLHGAFHVAGIGNAAENIVTVGGVDHLVVQNVFRTATGDYLAIALEA